MSLFSRLLRLHVGRVPTEDFLTEVARAALQHDLSFARDWLQHLGIAVGREAIIAVKTQVTTTRLSIHQTGARGDLVLEITDGGITDVVFVESKVNSGEGYEQLKRYAEILADRKNIRRRHLIYLTALHDPKADPAVPTVAFVIARWHEFYRLLSRTKPNPLTREILQFMATQGLSQGDRFSPADIVALRHVGRIANLMEAILGEEVYDAMKKMTGWTYPHSNFQLRFWNTAGGSMKRAGIYLMWASLLDSFNPTTKIPRPIQSLSSFCGYQIKRETERFFARASDKPAQAESGGPGCSTTQMHGLACGSKNHSSLYWQNRTT